MDDIKQFISQRDRFARHAGIELLHVSAGSASAKMKITPNHLNGVNIVHGGAIFTLADLTFAAASNSHGTVAVAINVSISYLKAVGQGTLFAEASEVSRNPKLALYMVTIKDDSKDLVAKFQGMVYRKKTKLLALTD
jgi:acyl-CoA thioesterase